MVAFFTWKVVGLGIVPPDDVYTGEGTLGQRFLTFVAALPKYLGLLVWPDQLSITHRFALAGGLADPRVLVGLGLLVAAAATLAFGRVALSLGVALFLVPLLPASNVVPITYAFTDMPFPFFERYLYIPSIGICLLASILLFDVARRFAPRGAELAAIGGALLLALPLGWRQWERAHDFRSSSVLFASAMRDGLAASEVTLGRAGALFREGRIDEAIAAYDAYVAEHPDTVDGRLERASALLELCEQYKQHALTHGQRGERELVEEIEARADELLARANDDIAWVLEREPDNGWAVELSAAAAGIGGDYYEAARRYRHATTLEGTTDRLPGNFRFVVQKLRDSAWAEAQKGLSGAKQSIYLYERALRAICGVMPPKEIPDEVREPTLQMLCEHADQLVLIGKAVQAVSAYRWILGLEPQTARAHTGLGYVAKQTGDRSEAYLQFKRALEIDPEAYVPLNEMFTMLMEDGDQEQAAEYLRRLQRLLREKAVAPDKDAPGRGG